jgi:hypothetical protein
MKSVYVETTMPSFYHETRQEPALVTPMELLPEEDTP